MITTQAVGRLVRDPELQYTPNSTPLCRFRLACDRARGREGASFLDIVVWGAAGEANAKWLAKGRQVAVSGNLEHRQWQSDDGSYRERYELNADHITWLAAPRNDSNDEDGPATNGSEPKAQSVTSKSAPANKKATAAKKSTTTKTTAKNGTARTAAAKAATGEEPF